MYFKLIKNLFLREYSGRAVTDNVVFFWVYELKQPIYEIDIQRGKESELCIIIPDEEDEQIQYYSYEITRGEFLYGSGDLVCAEGEKFFLTRNSLLAVYPEYEKPLIELEEKYNL